MDERIQATPNETRQLLKIAMIQQTPKLITNFALHFNKILSENGANFQLETAISDYSIGTFHFCVIHKTLFNSYLNWLNPAFQKMIDANKNCHTVFFNIFLVDESISGPIWIGQRQIGENFLNSKNTQICFNKSIREFWNGNVPLIIDRIQIAF